MELIQKDSLNQDGSKIHLAPVEGDNPRHVALWVEEQGDISTVHIKWTELLSIVAAYGSAHNLSLSAPIYHG